MCDVNNVHIVSVNELSASFHAVYGCDYIRDKRIAIAVLPNGI